MRIKEAISPEGGNNPSFPLTPASTPVSTLEDSERLSNQAKFESEAQTATAYQTVDGKREAENVTIGVNTGPSLLWENSRDNSCEKCCECKRYGSETCTNFFCFYACNEGKQFVGELSGL